MVPVVPRRPGLQTAAPPTPDGEAGKHPALERVSLPMEPSDEVVSDGLPARDARTEAQQRVGPGLVARVFEPSPPADNAWAARRWLGGNRRLPDPPPPDRLRPTREALHRLAAHVIAPARHRATGRFGLRWTLDGFGTPFFDDDRQIRVAGSLLIDQRGPRARSVPITTLRRAATFLETDIDSTVAAEHDTPGPGDPDAELGIDERASLFLGSWFGMAFAALETLRADPESQDATRPQLWPGHFDPAIEEGDDDHRASFGASPGDAAVAEPYLYVSVWWPERLELPSDAGEWNASNFVGRVLRLSDFPVGDPVGVAVHFWRRTRDDLARAGSRAPK